jgi:hypothetical protein
MDRKQAKELLPIIQAFAEGKTIEIRSNSKYNPGEWIETATPTFDIKSHEYRIKPEPKYRPFANAEECWQEMKKHEPFGWVKDKQDGHYALITAVEDGARATGLNGVIGWNFTTLKKYFDFADGTPFGIKVE